MRFEVIDDGTGQPLMKAGEVDENGRPVQWAEIGEVVDIPVDSQRADERQAAQRMLRGQNRKIRPVPAEPRTVEGRLTRDVKPEAAVQKGGGKKATKKRGARKG